MGLKKDNKKICLISSSGGHFEQLMRLDKILTLFNCFVVTEKTKYNSDEKKINYYLKQVNRSSPFWFILFLWDFILSFIVFLKEKPEYIISTGALCSLPMIFIGKLFGKKIIFIESFAKVSTPTKTGSLIYKKADLFFIQWEKLHKYYPNAIYLGGIY